jgi:hypothetical protein
MAGDCRHHRAIQSQPSFYRWPVPGPSVPQPTSGRDGLATLVLACKSGRQDAVEVTHRSHSVGAIFDRTLSIMQVQNVPERMPGKSEAISHSAANGDPIASGASAEPGAHSTQGRARVCCPCVSTAAIYPVRPG